MKDEAKEMKRKKTGQQYGKWLGKDETRGTLEKKSIKRDRRVEIEANGWKS